MHDIIYISDKKDTQYRRLKENFPLIKIASDIETAKRICLTKFYWLVFDDIVVDCDFLFDYTPDDHSNDYVHVFLNGEQYDGIALVPKHRNITQHELDYRFFVNRKEVNVLASNPKQYDLFNIENYNDYLCAIENTSTDMFWMSSANIQPDKDLIESFYISHHESQLRKQNHAFATEFGKYNGLFLCSKHKKLSPKEIEYRFLVNCIEHEQVGSTKVTYDIFVVENYNDYLYALENSKTEMFWANSVNIKANIPDLYFEHDNVFDRTHNHNFLHCGDKRNGLFLCSKHTPVTEKEIEHRFLVNAKEWDIEASDSVDYDVFEIDSYDEYIHALDNSKTEMFWMSSKNILATIPNMYFTHDNEYDRKQNHAFIHRVQGKDLYNGLFLCSKHCSLTQREVEHRFIVNAKHWDIVGSVPVEYDHFYIETYDDYLYALENTSTEMFWADSHNIKSTIPDLYFTHDNTFDRTHNHNFLHCGDKRNGLFLCSKHTPATEKEIEHRFLVNAKEWDIEASGPVDYDHFYIETYDDYLYALENSNTEMFWADSHNIRSSIPDLYFTHDNTFDRTHNHNFLHCNTMRNGLFLFSKHSPITQREIEHRFIVNAKEWDIEASGHVKYDHFYIETYDDYLYALENSNTEMFWADSHNIRSSIPDLYFTHDNTFDRTHNHNFLHCGDKRNGVFLLSKHTPISKKEIEHRFLVNAKEWDIEASGPVEYPVYEIDNYDQYLAALENSKTEMFWMSSANIDATIPDLYFTHDNTFDRQQNHAFVHRVDGRTLYNGLFLCSKHRPLTQREVEHRHIVNRKEWSTVGSGPKQYDIFTIDSYNDYLNAYDNSSTEMFWATSNNIKVSSDFEFDIYFSHDNSYDRQINHTFIHSVNGEELNNGVFLLSKHRPLTQKEVDHKFILNAKQWDIVASGPCTYDIVYPKTYKDYLNALKTSKTEMFWIVPDYVNPTTRFKFDTYFSHDKKYDREINHAYLNGKYHDGIVLCSKYAKFSNREFDYKFIANKKEVDIVISTPNPYDIVFISYQEPNADENYERILKRFPKTKRIHGVKGIHQAHIEAAKLCDTEMFWIIDGDAIIVDSFNFDYQVARWDKEMVHVWRSQNPVNDMVYGYGGVKLFPTDLTINMDTSKPDMTTSISSKFRAVHDISNITGFNTDAFNSYKSGFRECCKLSSKVIDRQKDDETEKRLKIWCTVGENKKYGKYAIAGAKAGAEYGEKHRGDLESLKRINDFEWLQEQFENADI